MRKDGKTSHIKHEIDSECPALSEILTDVYHALVTERGSTYCSKQAVQLLQCAQSTKWNCSLKSLWGTMWITLDASCV